MITRSLKSVIKKRINVEIILEKNHGLYLYLLPKDILDWLPTARKIYGYLGNDVYQTF